MNVVITGASRGIGYHTALKFSEDTSNRVFALSRNERGLEKLRNESGGKIITIAADISVEASIEQSVRKISEHCDSVDVLVNNAGKLIMKNLSDLSVSDWEEVYRVNVFGAFAMTKALLPFLKRGTLSAEVHAHVLNISSMGGVQGSMKFDGLSAYSSSKGALIILTECLSNELKSEDIRMNCLALGSVETDMFSEAFPGLKAGADVKEAAGWIKEFSGEGWRFFNGKTIPFSTMTP